MAAGRLALRPNARRRVPRRPKVPRSRLRKDSESFEELSDWAESEEEEGQEGTGEESRVWAEAEETTGGGGGGESEREDGADSGDEGSVASQSTYLMLNPFAVREEVRRMSQRVRRGEGASGGPQAKRKINLRPSISCILEAYRPSPTRPCFLPRFSPAAQVQPVLEAAVALGLDLAGSAESGGAGTEGGEVAAAEFYSAVDRVRDAVGAMEAEIERSRQLLTSAMEVLAAAFDKHIGAVECVLPPHAPSFPAHRGPRTSCARKECTPCVCLSLTLSKPVLPSPLSPPTAPTLLKFPLLPPTLQCAGMFSPNGRHLPFRAWRTAAPPRAALSPFTRLRICTVRMRGLGALGGARGGGRDGGAAAGDGEAAVRERRAAHAATAGRRGASSAGGSGSGSGGPGGGGPGGVVVGGGGQAAEGVARAPPIRSTSRPHHSFPNSLSLAHLPRAFPALPIAWRCLPSPARRPPTSLPPCSHPCSISLAPEPPPSALPPSPFPPHPPQLALCLAEQRLSEAVLGGMGHLRQECVEDLLAPSFTALLALPTLLAASPPSLHALLHALSTFHALRDGYPQVQTWEKVGLRAGTDERGSLPWTHVVCASLLPASSSPRHPTLLRSPSPLPFSPAAQVAELYPRRTQRQRRQYLEVLARVAGVARSAFLATETAWSHPALLALLLDGQGKGQGKGQATGQATGQGQEEGGTQAGSERGEEKEGPVVITVLAQGDAGDDGSQQGGAAEAEKVEAEGVEGGGVSGEGTADTVTAASGNTTAPAGMGVGQRKGRSLLLRYAPHTRCLPSVPEFRTCLHLCPPCLCSMPVPVLVLRAFLLPFLPSARAFCACVPCVPSVPSRFVFSRKWRGGGTVCKSPPVFASPRPHPSLLSGGKTPTLYLPLASFHPPFSPCSFLSVRPPQAAPQSAATAGGPGAGVLACFQPITGAVDPVTLLLLDTFHLLCSHDLPYRRLLEEVLDTHPTPAPAASLASPPCASPHPALASRDQQPLTPHSICSSPATSCWSEASSLPLPGQPGVGAGGGAGRRVHARMAMVIAGSIRGLVGALEAHAVGSRDDLALSELFLMNNLHHIASCLSTSSVGKLLGLAEVGAHAKHEERHRDRFLELSFARFHCLVTNDRLRRPDAIRRLVEFCSVLGDVLAMQQTWVVPDPHNAATLRSALRWGLQQMLQAFLAKH
ncbi:unnamed protein product, partial [Closterium sp. NIES-53]